MIMFKRLTKRKYLGLAIIVISIIFLLGQYYSFIPQTKPLAQNSGIAAILSGGGIVFGVYLVAGPLGALIATVPIVMLGGTGYGGGPPPPPPPKKDLGKPPQPPSE